MDENSGLFKFDTETVVKSLQLSLVEIISRTCMVREQYYHIMTGEVAGILWHSIIMSLPLWQVFQMHLWLHHLIAFILGEPQYHS